MTDEAHVWTDAEIKRIADELRLQYSEATAEMMLKQEERLKHYEAERVKLEKDLKEGRITKKQFKARMQSMAFTSRWYSDMIDSLAQGAVNADARAMDTINNRMPRVFAENYNYATYQIESGLNINTSFTLVDEDTVRRMVRDNPKLLPQKEIDKYKDTVWNKRKFNSAILQGTIQGEPLTDIAKRIENVMGMNYRAAYANARTACTAAQNAGRLESYMRMKANGIDVRKQWMATLDHHTRDTHRLEDDNIQEIEDRFQVTGLMYPGDPSTNDPGEVMNCRCTMVASFDEVSRSSVGRFSRLGKMSYKQWKKGRGIKR